MNDVFRLVSAGFGLFGQARLKKSKTRKSAC